MAALSDYLEERLLSLVFKNNDLAFTSPGDQLWLAAFTSGVGVEAGDLLGEVSGGAYARQQVPAADWTHMGSGVTNAVDIDFPVATDGWGTIVHAAIMDSATLGAGNVLLHGALTISRSVGVGDQLRFLVGEVEVGLD